MSRSLNFLRRGFTATSQRQCLTKTSSTSMTTAGLRNFNNLTYRNFSAAAAATQPDTTSRVLSAVRRHLNERVEDLEKESQESSASEDVKKRLEHFRAQAKTLAAENSSDTTVTWDSLGLDAFDRVEVLLEVEAEFGGTVIPDADADRIGGVKETVEWLEKNAEG